MNDTACSMYGGYATETFQPISCSKDPRCPRELPKIKVQSLSSQRRTNVGTRCKVSLTMAQSNFE